MLISLGWTGQLWFLDARRVLADGEWAAYVWADWSGGLSRPKSSFAALVDAERRYFEYVRGTGGPEPAL
jgi:hypothetical protein